jgi:hypothetical protein
MALCGAREHQATRLGVEFESPPRGRGGSTAAIGGSHGHDADLGVRLRPGDGADFVVASLADCWRGMRYGAAVVSARYITLTSTYGAAGPYGPNRAPPTRRDSSTTCSTRRT